MKKHKKFLTATLSFFGLGAIAAAIAVPTVLFMPKQSEKINNVVPLSLTNYSNLSQYGMPNENVSSFYYTASSTSEKIPVDVNTWSKTIATYAQLSKYVKITPESQGIGNSSIFDSTNLKITFQKASSSTTKAQIMIQMGGIGYIYGSPSNDGDITSATTWSWSFYAPLGNTLQNPSSFTPYKNLENMEIYFGTNFLSLIQSHLPKGIEAKDINIKIGNISKQIYTSRYIFDKNEVQYIWLYKTDNFFNFNNSLGALVGHSHFNDQTKQWEWTWSYDTNLMPVSLLDGVNLNQNGIPTNVKDINQLSWYLNLKYFYGIGGLLSNNNINNPLYYSNDVKVQQVENNLQRITITRTIPSYGSGGNSSISISVMKIAGIYQAGNWNYFLSGVADLSNNSEKTVLQIQTGTTLIPSSSIEAIDWASKIKNYSELSNYVTIKNIPSDDNWQALPADTVLSVIFTPGTPTSPALVTITYGSAVIRGQATVNGENKTNSWNWSFYLDNAIENPQISTN